MFCILDIIIVSLFVWWPVADEDGLLDYEVSVSTGSVSFAGTDANVYLRLVGRAGRSGEVALTNRARNNFEKGQTDVFKVGSPAYGVNSSSR